MILETNIEIENELRLNKVMISGINYNSISLYIDYFDFYAMLMTMVYNGHDRIIINSGVSFFIHLRNYILFSEDQKFDRVLVSKYFDKVLNRFKCLVRMGKHKIYLYKSSLEVREFCDYYYINYEIIKDHDELIHITKNIL